MYVGPPQGLNSSSVAIVPLRISTRDQQQANARLIAAAPELLAVLEHLVNRDFAYLDGRVAGGQIRAQDIQAARAAIAKAKGEVS
jgi:hypothetical protein